MAFHTWGGFMKLQKLGGYAAIASMCLFIIYVIVRGPSADLMDAAKTMAAYSARPAHFVVAFRLFSIGCILTLAMFLALHERMQANKGIYSAYQPYQRIQSIFS